MTGVRVSIITGLAVERDAISNIARQQLDAVARHSWRLGEPYPVKLYAQGSDVNDPRVHLAPSVESLLGDPHFHDSDVVVYHFGVYYALFDSIHLAPRSARVVVTYHGVTPPNLVPESDRQTVYRSYRQAANLHCADRVITGSRHLHRELTGMGVPVAKLGHVPYAVPFPVGEPPAKDWAPDRPRFLYVGRFSPAKGLRELIRAAGRLRREDGIPFELNLVGSKRFTRPEFLDELDELVRESQLGDAVRFRFDVPPAELRQHLDEADALVLPSYHEGFCVPVIEALSAGCFVITSDAAALPETAGGMGLLCPAGDADGLRTALLRFVRAVRSGVVPTSADGDLSPADWRGRVTAHLRTFTRENFERTLTAELFGGISIAPAEARAELLATRQALLRRPGDGIAPPAPRDAGGGIARSIAEGYRPRAGYGKFLERART